MEKLGAKIFLVIVITLFVYFFYFAVTSTPLSIGESDSLAYHIPIATQIAKGNFFPPNLVYGLGFYPATSEIFLAILVLTHLPLNLFGVIGWLLLFYAAFKVGRVFGLSRNISVIYGGSLVTFQSVLRWPLTQTVDIWLTVFFLASLYFLNLKGSPLGSLSWYIKLGISLGLLVGAKYSGLLYCIPLLIIFGKQILKNVNFTKLLTLMVPVSLLGLFWYIRNFVITGNPLYPANFLSLRGAPGFQNINYYDWTLLGNVIKNPKFILTFVQSLNSEYLFWWLAIPTSICLFFRNRKNEVGKLALLGLSVLLIFIFILPYWKGIDVSNLRFIYPAMACFLLSVFIFFKNNPEILVPYAIITSAFSITNLPYHPKIVFAGFIIGFTAVFIKKWTSQFV